SWMATTSGNSASSLGWRRPLGSEYRRNPARIGSPNRKCTMFASTLTIGRISAGNNTFLIRLPPEISTPADSASDEENQVHGRIPQNMNSANGSILGSCDAGITNVKTKE